MDHASDNPDRAAFVDPPGMDADQEGPTAIQAVPARLGPSGFRLLLLREFTGDGPSGFALIEQRLMRAPHRLNRHGLSFALTFRPDVMAELSGLIGRPSVRAGTAPATRNPLWPTFAWHRADRMWADGTATVEWSVDVHFTDATAWARFRAHFAHHLSAGGAGSGCYGERSWDS